MAVYLYGSLLELLPHLREGLVVVNALFGLAVLPRGDGRYYLVLSHFPTEYYLVDKERLLDLIGSIAVHSSRWYIREWPGERGGIL
jgi:hypothetical protein